MRRDPAASLKIDPISSEVEDTRRQSAIYEKAQPDHSTETERGVDSRLTIPNGL